jgi:hypothetical protein
MFFLTKVKAATYEDELEKVIQWMREHGLVPTGKGKPTRPSKAIAHDVWYDPDFDFYYLITKSPDNAIWTISQEGEANFIAHYSGNFKPTPNMTKYKDGYYHDYLPADAIRAILDIVDPTWDK